MPRGKNAWSYLVAAVKMETLTPELVREFSSFLMKYSVDNRGSLGVGWMDLVTVAATISTGIGEGVKLWVTDNRPSGSVIKDRFEFPVLVGLDEQRIYYFRKTPIRAGLLFRLLRQYCDRWFGFQNPGTPSSSS